MTNNRAKGDFLASRLVSFDLSEVRLGQVIKLPSATRGNDSYDHFHHGWDERMSREKLFKKEKEKGGISMRLHSRTD